MISAHLFKHWGGLDIGSYESSNIYPLLPLLKQEFPDWSSKQIKSYVELLTYKKKDVVTDILVARNEAYYYVGILI